MALTPFDLSIPEKRRDPKLLGKLKIEGTGILNFVMVGLRAYQKDGSQNPEADKAATAAYRDEKYITGNWIWRTAKPGQGAPKRKTFSMTATNDGPSKTANCLSRKGG